MNIRTLLFLSILLCCDIANAQWVRINNLDNIVCYAAKGNRLFVGTFDGKVYLSTDTGLSWTDRSTGLLGKQINSILISADNIFASTPDAGIYRSQDSGNNWIAVNNGLKSININGLALLGKDIYAMCIGAHGSNIYRSSDDGKNWNYIDSISSYESALGISGTNFFVGGYGMYLSKDSARSWVQINNGFGASTVISLAFSGTKVFASLGQDGVIFSNDTGSSWVQRRPENGGVIYSLAASGNNLFAGMEFYGVEHSTDDGLHWTQVVEGFIGHPGQFLANRLFIYEDYLFCIPASRGLWRRPLSEMIPTS
jgi:photosystem II stability/assembly factor-like uncharacterized protein